jgi:hypothetical protein
MAAPCPFVAKIPSFSRLVLVNTGFWLLNLHSSCTFEPMGRSTPVFVSRNSTGLNASINVEAEIDLFRIGMIVIETFTDGSDL